MKFAKDKYNKLINPTLVFIGFVGGLFGTVQNYC